MSKQFRRALLIPATMSVLIFSSFILEKGMEWDFHQAGIYPHHPESLGGIIGILFVHSDWSHLFNNLFSFALLSVCLFYFYHDIALKIFGLSILLSGSMLWMTGRESWHIGASGLIYAIATFLFVSGLIRKHVPLIAISLVVTFIYGSMVWHLFPWQVNDPVSWEGHLSGGITGLVLSIIYRKFGPQKPELEDDAEDCDIDYMNTENQESELDNNE